MKANSFGMLIFVIKLVTIFLCINAALSATLSDGQTNNNNNSTNEGSSDITTTIGAIEDDYDTSNASVEKSSDTKPPLVFPENDGDKSEASKNATALEILQKNSNISTQTKNETENVTESPSTKEEDTKDSKDDDAIASKETNSTINKEDETSKQQQEIDYDNLNEEDDSEKNDVENIQEEKDQGKLEETFGFNSTNININPFEEPTLKGGHIAAIFASSLILLSVVAYVGLVLWRSRLESRYGMRQRLVTEDDYYNNNDVRFFGL